ncbi:MAG: S1 RNA-binding domain-containing protein, partial [Candidatus Peribacteraceae bacterium]|nr:S1 RNA-binding domain-containing protein [Candidatus Peribacteraceae bacterium]
HNKIEDPSEVITIGKKVEAQVINIDIDERRIGLSLKALQPIDAATLAKIKAEQEAKENKSKEEEKPKKKKTKESKEAEESKEKEVKKEAKKEEETKKEEKDDKKESGFVASKSGKKYYALDSAQGQKIKDENRVLFATEKEAEKAGYSA